MASSAHLDAHADLNEARESPDLVIRQRNTALCPVERVVDLPVSAAQPVDAELSAEGSVLRRRASLFKSGDDALVILGIDPPRVECPLRVFGSRKVDAEEEMKSRHRVDAVDSKRSKRGGSISPGPIRGKATAAKRNIAETGEQSIPAQDRKGMSGRVDEDPALALRLSGAGGACKPDQGCHERRDRRPHPAAASISPAMEHPPHIIMKSMV